MGLLAIQTFPELLVGFILAYFLEGNLHLFVYSKIHIRVKARRDLRQRWSFEASSS